MSLYLKYRPKTFDDLVGQTFVKTNLKKAIEEGKTVGAYLLCGPRGTWKTTTARLLAKGVNCETWDACGNCKNCKDFENESLVDVIEIDAASNTWVDNIREIIERAKFQPTQTEYKVYIIDEVHMLSKWAFNALLKILEEPPSHVKFILATTEVHKIPETILSRCQRYDFKRITPDDIKSRLEYVCNSEGYEFEEKALEYIASIADWALRNALSLLEQYVIDNKVSYQNIVDNLGIVTEDELNSFFEKLINKDESVIADFENYSKDWKNLKLFVKDLLYFSKNKMIENIRSDSLSRIIHIVEELNEAYIKSKNSFDENVPFVVALVKIVTWVKPIEVTPEPIKVGVNTTKKVVKEPVKQEIVEEIPPLPSSPDEAISSNDVMDIFGWDDAFDIAPPAPVVEESFEPVESTPTQSTSSYSDFNFKEFTALVRKSKWFAFIWLSLTKATYRFDGNVIVIIPQNEAVYNKFNTIEVLDLFRDKLKELWVDYNVKIEL